MFRWSGNDKLRLERDQRILSASYVSVVCLIPITTSSSNYDDFTDSALDPTDTNTNTKGQVFSWTVREIKCRLGGATFTELMLNNENGLNKGDLALFIKQTDYDVMLSVLQNQDAYLYINRTRYKPFGDMSPTGVFSYPEFEVDCKAVTLSNIATGY